jgi:flagellar hook-associated protein 3 FlgL
MRVTDGMRYDSLLLDMSRAQDRVLKAQQQVSSGKKVSSPSDNPAAATDILRLNSENTEGDQYARNLGFAQSKLQVTDGALDNIEQMVERARTLGQLSFGNTGDSSGYVAELNGLRDQLISSANTTYASRFIFGGSMTTSAPFTKNPDSTVTANGNSQDMPLQVSRSLTLQTQVSGVDLFAGSVNVFDVMSNLTAAVQAGDKPGIDAQVKKLEQFSDVVSTARTKVGSYLNLATTANDGLTSSKLSRQTQLSQEEAADLAASISELSMSENGLQATFAVGARISQLSILDYLK